MNIGLPEVAVGVGVWWLLDYCTNGPKIPHDPGAPRRGTMVGRLMQMIRNGGGVDPLMKSRLDAMVYQRELHPNITDPSDPVRSMAELMWTLSESPLYLEPHVIPPPPAPQNQRYIRSHIINLQRHRYNLMGDQEAR